MSPHGLRLGKVFSLKANEAITAFLINVAVVVLYATTGGKNAKHAAVLKSSNISELSRLRLQLFENVVKSTGQSAIRTGNAQKGQKKI